MNEPTQEMSNQLVILSSAVQTFADILTDEDKERIRAEVMRILFDRGDSGLTVARLVPTPTK